MLIYVSFECKALTTFRTCVGFGIDMAIQVAFKMALVKETFPTLMAHVFGFPTMLHQVSFKGVFPLECLIAPFVRTVKTVALMFCSDMVA